jgi:drug/metabolite transporter (DMT)-like permease
MGAPGPVDTVDAVDYRATMVHLLLVSLLWAASPGLIKHELAGVPSSAISVMRLALTALMFAPWLRLRARTGLSLVVVGQLLAIGAVQFGLMYLLYLRAFAHLQAHEVFLFTALTPMFVVAVDGLWQRRIAARHVLAAVFGVVGAVVIMPRGESTASVVEGFLLVQGANLCFALGQVAYRRVRPGLSAPEHRVFAWLALGGFIATVVVAAPITSWQTLPSLLTARHLAVIAFLGVVSSGLGFFMWNSGLRRVNAGTLAVFNNAKIPLGVLVSVIVFQELADPTRLATSLLLLGVGVWMAAPTTATD